MTKIDSVMVITSTNDGDIGSVFVYYNNHRKREYSLITMPDTAKRFIITAKNHTTEREDMGEVICYCDTYFND